VALMILGLALFLGIHLLPAATRLRSVVAVRLGDNGYRGAFSVISAIGLILIVVGYRMAPNDLSLFAPSAFARNAAPLVVTLAFVLFASANMRTHIRHVLRHPMLLGLMLWSGIHLLANGDLAGTILFGSLFVYSIVDLASAIARGAVKPVAPTWKHDLIAIVSGVLLSWIVMRFHASFFGTAPVL
jgi:uncharacterized membrane protein